jgi:hypothetical protein
MTVTTPVHELLAAARRYEVEKRWAQAVHAYQEALDNMPHPTSAETADDRGLISRMMQMCIWRSHEGASLVCTVISEEAKWAVDRKGERAAAKRALALNPPKETG